MKTFATLTLLGFASAIKLQTGGMTCDDLSKGLASAVMATCDTNLDGICTLSEFLTNVS